MKYKYELIDVGRDNICRTYEIDVDDVSEVGKAILNSASNYLMSSNCWLTVHKDTTKEIGVFNINAGFHTVGKAKVTEVK